MFRIPSGKRSIKAVKSVETKEQHCSSISMMDAPLKGILVVGTHSRRSAERMATFVLVEETTGPRCVTRYGHYLN